MAQPPLESPISGKLAGAAADRTPLPELERGTDTRVLDAWCEWLGALATDAEAALAAAIAYRELDAQGRTSWLNALEQDSVRLKVPHIAVYAPLLAVESDPERRERITFAMGPAEAEATPRAAIQALSARRADGLRIATVVVPLYLDFVQVLACAYRPEVGFSWVRHDPIVESKRAPVHGHRLEGVELERTPLKALIDELSHAVLSQRRSGRELPEALRVFADLFGPNIEGSTPPPPSAP
ncbi:MAG TPA: hypothetical protein VNG33_19995 [Polyangiaceae bacterium]|nr:hypothetical protein [Polyangiaceae bacterium]